MSDRRLLLQLNLYRIAVLTVCVSPCRIIELNGGQSPLTYKRFQTLISRMDAVEVPVESITAEIMGKCSTPLSEDHDDKFGVPSLEELGEQEQTSRQQLKLNEVVNIQR